MQPIRRRILTLALPIILSSVLERMVQIVDIFLVGGLGATAIASVGLSQLLIMTALNLLAGLTMGATIMVAQLWGARRRREAAEIATQALRFGLLLALGSSLLGVIGGDVSARALGATPDMQALMHGYLLINFGLFIFVFAVDQLVATMQGAGDTRTPMIAVTIVNTLHILIAYPLIYGRWGAPALGVNGAALAIGLSESVGSIYLYAKARRAGHLIPLFGRHTGPPPLSSLRHILRVGWPITFDRLLQQGAQLAYARIILGYGAVVYAAHQVGMNIEALSFMPGNGFAVAAVTAVGQSIGAQKLAKAKIENWEANRLAVLLMAGMGLLFFCFPYLLLRAFTTDAAVIGYGTLFLKIVGVLQIPLAITMVLSGSLKGAGDTRFLLLVTAIGAWLVRVPLAAIFTGLGLTIGWVWSVMLVDWTIRMGCLIWRYRSERWQRSLLGDRLS